jgi:hypothetical protein
MFITVAAQRIDHQSNQALGTLDFRRSGHV